MGSFPTGPMSRRGGGRRIGMKGRKSRGRGVPGEGVGEQREWGKERDCKGRERKIEEMDQEKEVGRGGRQGVFLLPQLLENARLQGFFKWKRIFEDSTFSECLLINPFTWCCQNNYFHTLVFFSMSRSAWLFLMRNSSWNAIDVSPPKMATSLLTLSCRTLSVSLWWDNVNQNEIRKKILRW